MTNDGNGTRVESGAQNCPPCTHHCCPVMWRMKWFRVLTSV